MLATVLSKILRQTIKTKIYKLERETMKMTKTEVQMEYFIQNNSECCITV